jgi:endoglucanase
MKRKLAVAALFSLAVPSAALAKTDSLPVGRCVNMGNSLEAPTEGEWGGKKIDAADFKRIAGHRARTKSRLMR